MVKFEVGPVRMTLLIKEGDFLPHPYTKGILSVPDKGWGFQSNTVFIEYEAVSDV